MSIRRTIVLIAALAAVLGLAVPAGAQTLPANSGDFAVNIDLGGAPEPGAMPDCTPSLDSLAALFMQGQSSVTAVCTSSSTATQKATNGTVANAALAASTGDAGFNTGTIAATCDATQTVDFTLAITMSGSSMSKFGGVAWYGCSFAMTFQDAAKSTLVGTIEVNAKLGSADGSVTGSTIDIKVDGTVYVTGGTGAFEGATGSGTFDQQQTFTIPSTGGSAPAPSGGGNSGGSAIPDAACVALGLAAGCTSAQVQAACQNPANAAICSGLPRKAVHLRIAPRANASTMKVKLKKGAGAARILTPAAPAGKKSAPAKVKATTKVRMTATTGASCTVKASTGATVGTGTATGRFGALTIRPKAGAYTGARWIKATCTKGGKSFSSNKVKITM